MSYQSRVDKLFLILKRFHRDKERENCNHTGLQKRHIPEESFSTVPIKKAVVAPVSRSKNHTVPITLQLTPDEAFLVQSKRAPPLRHKSKFLERLPTSNMNRLSNDSLQREYNPKPKQTNCSEKESNSNSLKTSVSKLIKLPCERHSVQNSRFHSENSLTEVDFTQPARRNIQDVLGKLKDSPKVSCLWNEASNQQICLLEDSCELNRPSMSHTLQRTAGLSPKTKARATKGRSIELRCVFPPNSTTNLANLKQNQPKCLPKIVSCQIVDKPLKPQRVTQFHKVSVQQKKQKANQWHSFSVDGWIDQEAIAD